MTYNTVAEARHRADPLPVKPGSGFGETRRERRSWLRKPKPPAPTVEHSTFPSPNLPTQVIPAQRQPRPTVKPSATVHGNHPAHLLFAVVHRAIDVCADPKADHRTAYDALAPLMQSLLEGAKAEANFDRRAKDNEAAATAQGATLEDAAKRGHDIGPNSPHGKQAVADIVDRARRAPMPQSTELMSALTPEVLDRLDAGTPVEDVTQTQVLPRVETVAASASPSPVHVPGEDLRPPVPGDEECADPGVDSPLARKVLPHRPRVTVMPAPMTSGEHPEPIGLRDARPARGEVGGGDWVFDDSGADGAGVLKLVRDVAVVFGADSEPVGARVFFAVGGDRRVAEDRMVQVMSADEAAALVLAREVELDALEATQ